MSSSYQNSGSSSDSGVNVFTPDTPDSGDWQQYRCSHCDLPKRIAVKPSMAQRTIPTGCERCGAQTKHHADGGAALPMIDLTKNPDISPAEIVGGLRSGRTARTPVTDDGEHVHLVADDVVCPRCDEDPLIPFDSFGENTPYFSLLANQKLQRGETYCAPHHKEVTSDE